MKSLLLVAMAAVLFAADPYDAWAQGRPADALPGLLETAHATQRWDAWLDAGLAAAATGDRGRAVDCLARAHGLAPERPESGEALRALGVNLEQTWSERAGPLAWPGTGWTAVGLLGFAGLALGWGVAGRKGRGWALASAGVAVFLAAPGVGAAWWDGRTEWVGVVRDTQALDSTGTPRQALAAGTLVVREPAPVWAGRVLVRLGDGSRAYVVETDVTP